MRVKRPLKEIKSICKSNGIDVTVEQIEEVLKANEEIIYDKLLKGEDVKIPNIGKITTSIITVKSNLTKQETQNVKFKYTPFVGIKKEANEKFKKIQAKYL